MKFYIPLSTTKGRFCPKLFKPACTVSVLMFSMIIGLLLVMPLAAADLDRNGYTDLLYGAVDGVTFMKANNTGTGFTEISVTKERMIGITGKYKFGAI